MPWPTSESPPPIQRRTLAVHEAGHAVAYLALGRKVKWVSVDFDEIARRGHQDGSTAGMVEEAKVRDWRLPRGNDWDDLTISLAGPAAVAVEFGCDVSWGCRSITYDVREAVRILGNLRKYLSHPPDWLLQSDSDPDWRPALNHAVIPAFAVVRSHASAVLALAAALLEHGTIQGTQARRIFASECRGRMRKFGSMRIGQIRHKHRRMIASAGLLTLAACGGGAAQAPGCDAEATIDLALREAAAVIGERGGMRRVPGNPDQLLDSQGDTVHLTPGGGHMWVRTADGKGVAALENVRSTGRDPQAGTWTCAADFVLTFFDTPDGTLRGPIEYRSEITQGRGPRQHVVRVVPAGRGG